MICKLKNLSRLHGGMLLLMLKMSQGEKAFITHLDCFHFLPLFHTFTQEELSCGQLLVHLQRRARITPAKLTSGSKAARAILIYFIALIRDLKCSSSGLVAVKLGFEKSNMLVLATTANRLQITTIILRNLSIHRVN